MAGAWRGGLGFANGANYGANTGASTMTSVFTAGSSFVKGAWTQLTASTTNDIAWLMITGSTMTSGGSYFAVDLAVGGSGSEVAIITNLSWSSTGGLASSYMLPVAIPIGTRVSARVSGNNATDPFHMHVAGFDDMYMSAGSGCSVDTYGYSTSTNIGTAVDPGGSANTKGSWVQITSSTTNDMSGFCFVFDTQTISGSAGTTEWLYDVGIGAGGSEQVIVPNFYQLAYMSGGTTPSFVVSPYYPIPIASGTRIAARAQCSKTTTPDRTLGITVYGVRQ